MYNDFVAFVEAEVLPRQAANPDHIRLDGMTAGGSLEVAGKFRHRQATWVVHVDSHYEPLLIAYAAAKDGRDPFAEESTERGRCLVLTSDLRSKQTSAHKYMYIYSWATDAT